MSSLIRPFAGLHPMPLLRRGLIRARAIKRSRVTVATICASGHSITCKLHAVQRIVNSVVQKMASAYGLTPHGAKKMLGMALIR
jgi:hypothetical protein